MQTSKASAAASTGGRGRPGRCGTARRRERWGRQALVQAPSLRCRGRQRQPPCHLEELKEEGRRRLLRLRLPRPPAPRPQPRSAAVRTSPPPPRQRGGMGESGRRREAQLCFRSGGGDERTGTSSQGGESMGPPRWPPSWIRRRSSSIRWRSNSNQWRCSSIWCMRRSIWPAERSSSPAMEDVGEGAGRERKRGTLL
jgi:hypothetical protein